MKPIALFLSSHLPTDDIPIAGQKIAYQHLVKISQHYDVILVTFVNSVEKKFVDLDKYHFCKEVHLYHVTKWKRFFSIFRYIHLPVRVSQRMSRKVLNIIHKIQHTYSIDLFHAEYTTVGEYVHHLNHIPNREIVEHDITFQSYKRFYENKSGLYSLYYKIEYLRQKKWELKLLDKFSKVIVLNKKDEQLLQDHHIENIDVWLPQVPEWLSSITRENIETFSIMFLGALNRFENVDAILWFVQDVFPVIEKRFPDTKLYIVGSNPPEKIKKLETKNIKVTGFVKNLSDYFERAHIAISPLKYGAGIKIKTLETISAKIPTISTDVGAEGVPESDFLIRANSKDEFIKSIEDVFA